MRTEFQKLRPSEFVHPYKLPFLGMKQISRLIRSSLKKNAQIHRFYRECIFQGFWAFFLKDFLLK